MTAQVALVMAPLLPRICTGEGNVGWKYGGGGGSRWGWGSGQEDLPPPLLNKIDAP